MKINSTKRYDQFKTTIGNRLINKEHLLSLKKSIQRRNLLQYTPIIVNADNEVIDGQHRLQAARSLNTEIYFLKANGLKLEDVIILNTSSKQWRFDDYLQSYIDQGFDQYKQIRKFAEKHHVSVSNAVAILSAQPNLRLSAKYRDFKQGKFEVVDIDHAEEFAQRLREVAIYTTENTWKDREFMRALHSVLYDDDNVEYDSFLRKLQSYPKPIFRSRTTREYLRQLEDIYNQNLIKKVRFY